MACAPAATDKERAFCWRVERAGSPPLRLGDLVRLPGGLLAAPGAQPALGLVRELPAAAPGERGHFGVTAGQGPGTCLVSPLLAGGGPGAAEGPAEDLRLPIADLEVLDASVGGRGEAVVGPDIGPAAVVEDFRSESAFGNLVFQPGGMRPLAEALRKRRCKVCVLGGSISLQKAGYRASFVKALERRGVAVEDLPASVGTAGSKPLALVTGDLAAAKQPDLLLVEAAVNDGDELLEATPRPDLVGVLRAAEGIVRTVRRRSPGTTVVFLEMFLRDDEEAARVLKTGSEAWRDSENNDAIGWYHEVAPRLHRHVCRRYGLAQVDLVPAMRSLTLEERREWFRDDCHHTDVGGEHLGNLLARILLWAVRQPPLAPAAPQAPAPGAAALPPALDARCWCNGRTLRIAPGWLTPPHATRRDS